MISHIFIYLFERKGRSPPFIKKEENYNLCLQISMPIHHPGKQEKKIQRQAAEVMLSEKTTKTPETERGKSPTFSGKGQPCCQTKCSKD
jgi:hypothetical protein